MLELILHHGTPLVFPMVLALDGGNWVLGALRAPFCLVVVDGVEI